ncbi:hypothetical protein [Pseudobythopirellula maris]|uniref:hypothetical protein n=1 Tax=Pseudobythopirellula maris TaxID=2527991 RepID=UPI0011B7C1DC|nr:hypothetical protein [Pseudobythopirellula maris]
MPYKTQAQRLLIATALLAAAAACAGETRAQSLPGFPSPAAAEAETTNRGFWGKTAWTYRRMKLHCQTSEFGRFLRKAVRPLSAMSGGLIPAPPDNHFAAAVEQNAAAPIGMAPGAVPAPPPPPPPAVAAAAKINLEKSQAKIRREAVAYLAGLDCRYYPEAEAGLIAALRADSDECVRLEAARSLLSGCCCTPAVVQALSVCVSGGNQDGNPGERSQRVRMTALAALQKCESCGSGGAAPAQRPEAPLSEIGIEGRATPVAYQTASITAESATAAAAPASAAQEPWAAEPAQATPAPRKSFVGLWREAARTQDDAESGPQLAPQLAK